MKRQTLTTKQLAKRWGCSPSTLANWRWKKIGPPYRKLLKRGNPVIYDLAEIIKFEEKKL